MPAVGASVFRTHAESSREQPSRVKLGDDVNCINLYGTGPLILRQDTAGSRMMADD